MEETKQRNEKLQRQIELVRSNPYEYICTWIEEIFPHVGKKVFSVLALMPCSLIIPDIPFMSKTVRSNINCLFLAPPASAKSVISHQFSMLTYNTIQIKSVTEAKLIDKIASIRDFSFIVDDFAQMAQDKVIVKITEGILGEEKKISRETMRGEKKFDVNGIGLLCGTPQDLSQYLTGGLIFRLVPVIVFHDAEEHSLIGKHISQHIGKSMPSEYKEEAIRLFYQELALIQNGEHPDIKPIKGYSIDESFNSKAYSSWDKMTRPIVAENSLNFFREYQEFFRFLLSHAFLNVHHRKVVDGVLYPNSEDFEVALKLMKESIKIKFKLLRTEKFARGLRNMQDLTTALSSPNIDEEDKNILKNLVKLKRN